MRNGEKEMFTEDHFRDSDILRSSLISLFIKDRITFDEFSRRHREYMLSLGESSKKITTSRNNLIKEMLNKSTMTLKMFDHITKNILQYRMTNVTFRLRDKDNKEYVLSSDRITF